MLERDLKPDWLNDLAEDAVLTSTVSKHPVIGRENIIRAVQAAGRAYISQQHGYEAQIDNRVLAEYDALLPGNVPIHGVVTITLTDDGRVSHVGVYHSPLEGVLLLAKLLGEAGAV